MTVITIQFNKGMCPQFATIKSSTFMCTKYNTYVADIKKEVSLYGGVHLFNKNKFAIRISTTAALTNICAEYYSV